MAAAVLFCAALGVPAAAQAASAQPACTHKGAAAGKATTAQALMAASAPLYQAGSTQAQVDAMFTGDWCLVKIGSGRTTGVHPMGGIGNNDVLWTTSLWFDRDAGYFAQGNWSWQNHDYATGFNFGCTSQNVGGRDGIGLRLSASDGVGYTIMPGETIEGWGDPGLNSYNSGNYGVWSLTQPSNVDQFGMTFVKQDHEKALNQSTCGDHVDFDMYAGEILFGISSLSGHCIGGQVFPMDIHTWNTTGITGFGVDLTGFSVQWEHEGSDFEWSEVGASGNVC